MKHITKKAINEFLGTKNDWENAYGCGFAIIGGKLDNYRLINGQAVKEWYFNKTYDAIAEMDADTLHGWGSGEYDKKNLVDRLYDDVNDMIDDYTDNSK